MAAPQEPAQDESNLFSDIRALLEEHQNNLVTHIESCVYSAVSRSLAGDAILPMPGPIGLRAMTMARSTSSLSLNAELGKEQDALPTAGPVRQVPSRRDSGRDSQSLTMSERDDIERQLASEFHEKEECERTQTLSKNAFGEHKVSWMRKRVRETVEVRQFEVVCAVLILMNSVVIGVEIQMNIDNPQHNMTAFFVVTQCIFCVVFTLELILRMVAEGVWTFVSSSEHLMWNYVDVFIVGCMMVEVAIQFILTFSDKAGSGSMRGVGNVRLLRILRVFRLIRTLRMVRVIRFVRDLRLLMNSIFSTLCALGWSMMLLMMIIYVFAIIFTQEASDFLIEKDPLHSEIEGPVFHLRLYFGSLSESMFTLFKSISNGVSWHEPVEALDEISFLCVSMFAVYIAFVYFAVLNVVTGVFCTSAIESSLRDHEHAVHAQIQNKKMWQKKMQSLFKSIDADGSRFINIHEFEQGLATPSVRAYMASMELDPDDAWTLFKLLDTDSTQSVDVEEFVLGCLRLRGPARSLDVAKLIYDTRMMAKRQEVFMDFVESQLSRLALYSHYTAGQMRQQKKKGIGTNGTTENLPPVLAKEELHRSRLRSNSMSRQHSPIANLNLSQLDGDMYGVLSARSCQQDEEKGVNGISKAGEIASEPRARAPALIQPRG